MKKKREIEKEIEEELKFSKTQIVASKRYEKFRDFLAGNLKEDGMYSFKEVDAVINRYMKAR